MREVPLKLYVADTGLLAEESVFQAACASVSAARRKKTDQLADRNARAQSLLAELLLFYAFRELGLDPKRCVFQTGACGKPLLTEPEGVFFNLSHSGQAVICAIAPVEVGCDIEQMTPRSMRIANRFFHENEKKRLAACGSEAERLELLYRFWTLKESFLKVTGQGMRLPLNAFELLTDTDPVTVRQSVDERSYVFREYQIREGYACAVCTAGDAGTAEVETVTRQTLFRSI